MEDVIVYKYRDWSKKFHKKMLTDNELYLSSPAELNDPFDCKIPINFGLLDSPEKKSQYAEEVTLRYLPRLLNENRNPVDEKMQFLHTLENDLEQHQEKYAQREFQDSENYTGVLSLTYRWDSILMWSHYSNNHRGFCVGFYREKLISSGLFGTRGDVKYCDNFPEISPLDFSVPERKLQMYFKQTHYKAKDWQYEKEYRLSRTFPNKATIDDRKTIVNNDFIAEVILGLKISEKDKKAISRIAKKKGFKVFEIYQEPFRFQLKKRPII